MERHDSHLKVFLSALALFLSFTYYTHFLLGNLKEEIQSLQVVVRQLELRVNDLSIQLDANKSARHNRFTK